MYQKGLKYAQVLKDREEQQKEEKRLEKKADVITESYVVEENRRLNKVSLRDQINTVEKKNDAYEVNRDAMKKRIGLRKVNEAYKTMEQIQKEKNEVAKNLLSGWV